MKKLNANEKILKTFLEIIKGFNVEGIKKYPGSHYDYQIQTNAGPYVFTKPDTTHHLCSIFGRFKEKKQALGIYTSNPFSGKYNFHYRDSAACLKHFKNFLTEATTNE